MKDTCYIKVTKRGIPADKIYKSPPSLKSGEICIKINMTLPDSIFGSAVEASLVMTEEQVKNRTVRELELELKAIKEKE